MGITHVLAEIPIWQKSCAIWENCSANYPECCSEEEQFENALATYKLFSTMATLVKGYCNNNPNNDFCAKLFADRQISEPENKPYLILE